MDTKIRDQNFIVELVKFAKNFARSKMPRYEHETLLIALYPNPYPDDEMSKALCDRNKASFAKIAENSYCRMFVLKGTRESPGSDFEELSLENIHQGPGLKCIKYIAFTQLSDTDFNMRYGGAEIMPGEVVSQKWKADIKWNGVGFEVLERTARMTEIS